jgi:hypothetical protein
MYRVNVPSVLFRVKITLITLHILIVHLTSSDTHMFRVNINLIITSMINHTALAEVENRTDDSNQTVSSHMLYQEGRFDSRRLGDMWAGREALLLKLNK